MCVSVVCVCVVFVCECVCVSVSVCVYVYLCVCVCDNISATKKQKIKQNYGEEETYTIYHILECMEQIIQ